MEGIIPVKEAGMKSAWAITIAGDPGVGKTLLAATFPKPIIIRVEDGAASISHLSDAFMTPLIKRPYEVNDWLDRLAKEKHHRKTLVIDSITALDAMVESEIVKSDKANSLQSAFGGYGSGSRALGNRMREVREKVPVADGQARDDSRFRGAVADARRESRRQFQQATTSLLCE